MICPNCKKETEYQNKCNDRLGLGCDEERCYCNDDKCKCVSGRIKEVLTNKEEIIKNCRELEASLLERLESDNLVNEAIVNKEKSRKRVQLAKQFLSKE
jgi:hypothetical protein